METSVFRDIRLGSRRLAFSALMLLAVAVSCWVFRSSFGMPPWKALGSGVLLVAGSAWLGWALRQSWGYPRRLRQAEALWVAEATLEEIEACLWRISLATGEIGYRAWMLRARVHMAKGDREGSWRAAAEAHRVRLPFWSRCLLGLCQGYGLRKGWMVLAEGMLRLAPELPRLRHAMGIRLLAREDETAQDRAWGLLLSSLPFAGEDIPLLEELMRLYLHRLETLEEEGSNLGRCETAPDLQAGFERALELLVHRHGDPRLGWDRATPALHLLSQGRYGEVLALCQSLAVRDRSEGLWVAAVLAIRRLGDLQGAWKASEEAVSCQPDSYRLWMIRHELAMMLRRNQVGKEALQRASELLSKNPAPPVAQLWEWRLRKAECLYWIDKDPEGAWEQLSRIPEDHQGDHHPPLRFQIRLDLGEFEAVHQEAAGLLETRPGDLDLQFVEAECLAGLEAWEALLPYLDEMDVEIRQRADFWHLRGLCRSHLGDLPGAKDDLERCVQLEPSNLRFVMDAGHAWADLGDWLRASHLWRHGLTLDERNEEALTQLAEARRYLLDPEGAKRLLRECLLYHPESEMAQVMLAELEAN